jgi:hypothetical protein
VMWQGAEHGFVLIASRWKGDSIVGAEATSVFILLVPPLHAVADGFSHKEYAHVAWGMCHVTAPNNAMEPTR